MKIIILKKLFLIAGLLSVFFGLAACQKARVHGDVQLPKGTVGAISFQGNGIVLLNKAGKRIAPSKIDVSKGRVLRKATIETIKVNPCVVRWCPSDGVCEVYVYEEMQSCPAWW